MNNTTFYSGNATTNVTYGRNALWDFFKRSRFIFAVFEGTLTPVIIIVNLVVIVAIISNPHLRQNFRYLAIVSIAVADVIIGLVSCPVRADIILKSNLNHGCGTYMFISVFENYVQMFIGAWGIFSINMDYLVILLQVKLPKLSDFQRKLAIALCIGLPWVAMCCIILPVAVTHAGRVYVSTSFCRVSLNKSAKAAVIYVAFMIPGLLIVIQAVVMTVVHITKRVRSVSAFLVTPEISSPWMLVCASLVTVLFVFAEQFLFLLKKELLWKLGLNVLAILYFSTVSVSDAKSAVLPFVWFMCPKIRESCLDLYNKLPWRRTVDVYRSDLTVDYKNLEEEGHT